MVFVHTPSGHASNGPRRMSTACLVGFLYERRVKWKMIDVALKRVGNNE